MAQKSTCDMELDHHLLLSFPVDVLADITSRIEAHELARLWNCGNKQLQEALGSRGGAKVFYFESVTQSASKWPLLLRQLPHLTQLSIINSNLECEPVNLLEASSCLRKLELSIAKPLTCFLNAVSQTSSHFAHLEDLEITDRTGSIECETFSLLKTVSSLTRLHLWAPTYTGSTQDFLPPNLTSLTYIAEELGTVDFNLPRSLQTFECWIGSDTKTVNVGALPSSLRSFSFSGTSSKLTPSEAALLPRELEELNTPTDDRSPKELIAALPPRLRSWKVYSPLELSDDLLALLPRSLTFTNATISVTAKTVSFLPPNLTELGVTSNDLNMLSKLPLGLKMLSSCRAAELIHCESGTTPSLPPNLERLLNFSAEILDFVTLPESLMQLSLVDTRFTTAHALLLPQGLQSLDLFDFEPESLAHLPQGLQSFIASNYHYERLLTADMVSRLPPTLRYFCMSASCLGSDDALSFFPQSLVTLSLVFDKLPHNAVSMIQLSKLEDLQLEVTFDEAGLGSAIVANLPRSLTRFRYMIRNPQFDDISLAAIQNLPPNLVSLFLPPSKEIQTLNTLPAYCNQKLKISSGRKWLFAR